MLQCLIVGQAPWPLTQTADPTETSKIDLLWSNIQNIKKHTFQLKHVKRIECLDCRCIKLQQSIDPFEGWERLKYNEGAAELPVHVLRMMQWSMIGLQFTVISKQWCALWCWADLSSGLNCRRDKASNLIWTSLCAYLGHFSKGWM